MNIKSDFIQRLRSSGIYKAYASQFERILNKYSEFLQFDPFEVKDDYSNVEELSNQIIAKNKLLRQDPVFLDFNSYGNGIPSALMGKVHYLDYLKEIKFTKTVVDGDYFNLKGFSDYKKVAKTRYNSETKEAEWYKDTRQKLYRLVELLGDRLNENFGVVYREKPNGQAGPATIIFKNYVLAGFSPVENSVGKELYMKVEFSDLVGDPVFCINLDMNFSEYKKYYKHSRENIFKNDYKEWPVDESFPKNWNELLLLITDSIKKLQNKYITYINEKKNSEMISNEIQGFIKILNYKKQIILQGPPGTGKTKLAKEIAAAIIYEDEELININIGESEQYKMVQFHPSYTYEDFVRGISSKPNETGSGIVYKAENKILGEFAKEAQKNYLESTEANIIPKKYVLIIDEINRANLSSVLGELIYGLEYRGDEVDSIYSIDDSNKLVLPPNLLIIGTMNTADRSVGSIDYAIRRRFAFINLVPKILTDVPFETDLFKQVTQLFVKDIETEIPEPSEYLSSEFKPEDVWLGHSYFMKITDEFSEPIPSWLRLEYEIKPLLKEYLNDGIFKDKGLGKRTIDFINDLSV